MPDLLLGELNQPQDDQGSSYASEVFCTDDGGDGPFWVTADGRTALDAAKLVNGITTLDHPFTVDIVTGRIEQTSDGPFFHLDADGDLEMWEVAL